MEKMHLHRSIKARVWFLKSACIYIYIYNLNGCMWP